MPTDLDRYNQWRWDIEHEQWSSHTFVLVEQSSLFAEQSKRLPYHFPDRKSESFHWRNSQQCNYSKSPTKWDHFHRSIEWDWSETCFEYSRSESLHWCRWRSTDAHSRLDSWCRIDDLNDRFERLSFTIEKRSLLPEMVSLRNTLFPFGGMEKMRISPWWLPRADEDDRPLTLHSPILTHPHRVDSDRCRQFPVNRSDDSKQEKWISSQSWSASIYLFDSPVSCPANACEDWWFHQVRRSTNGWTAQHENIFSSTSPVCFSYKLEPRDFEPVDWWRRPTAKSSGAVEMMLDGRIVSLTWIT